MDLEHQAIERLKMASQMSIAYYEQPLIITTSGGKDSDVCLELARRSGIPYEVQHSLTTADAPQTIYHVRSQFRNLELAGIKCTINLPMYKGRRTSMWELIAQKGTPPTRLQRYCCSVLKEQGGRNRMITTGVRWEESTARKKNRGIYEKISADIKNKIILTNDNDDTRRLFENCTLKAKRACNPIIDWTFRNAWDFIQSENIQTNILYQMGFDRVGCIGCPIACDKRYFEFRMFPTYETAYRHAFDRMVITRKAKGKIDEDNWSTGDKVFAWWMNENPDQLTFDQLAELQAAGENDVEDDK